MWKVDEYPLAVTAVVSACVDGVRKDGLTDRVLASSVALEENHRRLRRAVTEDATHLVQADNYTVPGVEGEEMNWLYENQLARKGRQGRKFYDAILGSARDGLCSYCQYHVAGVLDHFLPKDVFKALSIDPHNLVPACDACNRRKGNKHSQSADEQMLHPYSVDLPSRWLYAVVVEEVPVSVKFEVRLGEDVDQILAKRIHFQFGEERLKLGGMYAVVAGKDIQDVVSIIWGHGEVGDSRTSNPLGVVSVRAHLAEMATSLLAADPNSRKGVLYEALAESEWFCSKLFES